MTERSIRRLALATATLALAFNGCSSETDNGIPVVYGKASTADEVLEALAAPVANSNPTATKIGAFVHFMTTQNIGAGQVFNVLADTGQTVIDRTEDTTSITYSLVVKQVKYREGSDPEKMSQEYQLAFKRPTSQTTTEADEVKAEMAATLAARPTKIGMVSPLQFFSQDIQSRVKVRTTATRVSYHGLKTETYEGDPPAAISRPMERYAAIPAFKMNFTKVSFDEVSWDEPQGERIHFEFWVSPDVPQTSGFNMSSLFGYYPGLVKSCVTLMVGIGDGRSKTLLTECQEVVNFRYEFIPES